MTKVLILGGGFGGIRTALDLNKKLAHLTDSEHKNQAEITLIDKNSYHFFIPAIYEVASAFGIKKDPFAVQLKKTICIPYADIFDKTSVNFIQAEISQVDLKNKTVFTKGEHVFEYDYLVISLGSETSDYNIPGVKDYTHQFKTLDNALFINQKLDELSEQFISGHRTEPFSFLICGGGFTGLELAAELGCCSKAIKSRCKLKGRCSTITLIEAGPKILPIISDKARIAVKKRLTNLGIIIMENSQVEKIDSNLVKLKSGHKLEGDLIVWTAGIKPTSFLSSIPGLPLSSRGKVPVDSHMRVEGMENVFASGDNAEYIDPKIKKPVLALAYVAADQGKVIATNINNLIKNKKLKKYKPFYSAINIPIGGKYVYFALGRISVKGFAGWLISMLISIRYFLTILPPYKAFKLFLDEMTVFIKND